MGVIPGIERNIWWEYYDDSLNKLHADMMYFREFIGPTGESFILISNDGGLYESYDEMKTVKNIGTLGLNVSQYYTVRTDPLDPKYVYAGAQDQGFQRASSITNFSYYSMEQLISGDYAHIVFSNNGGHLWTVYPGGWVSLYMTPQSGYLNYGWTVESDNESVWLPPLVESSDPSHDHIYMVGGNAEGGPGSYIIKLINNQMADSIEVENLPFDFFADAGTYLSALEISKLDPDLWYAATENGLFYTSYDAGQTWESSIAVGPSPQYLYGQAILASKLDEQKVFIAGSGYSTYPVYMSTDQGKTFTDISEGMPPTVVLELATNEDESMLFAATEAGPYVYLVEDETWYDMSGAAAPASTYWSVEYVSEYDLVRFGTYGRGIWDFQIDEVSTSLEEKKSVDVSIFPNPASDNLFITGIENAKRIRIVDMQGKVVLQNENIQLAVGVNVSHLYAGTYILEIISTENERISRKLVKQ